MPGWRGHACPRRAPEYIPLVATDLAETAYGGSDRLGCPPQESIQKGLKGGHNWDPLHIRSFSQSLKFPPMAAWKKNTKKTEERVAKKDHSHRSNQL